MYQLRYANSPLEAGEQLIRDACDADLHARHRGYDGIHCDRDLTVICRVCEFCEEPIKDGQPDPHSFCASLVRIIRQANPKLDDL